MKQSQKMTKAMRKQTVRYLAMKILVDAEQNHSFVNLQLSHVLNQQLLSVEDSNLLTELVYGTTQRKLTLDYYLKPYITKKIPLWLQTLLRLSVFQIVYLTKIPHYAIVNEASEITRIKAGQSIVNFVNGVLRNVLKHYETQREQLEQMPLSLNAIHLQTSTPKWLVQQLIDQLGLQEANAFCQSLLEKPSLAIRVTDSTVNTIIEDVYNGQKSAISPVSYRMPDGKILKSSLFQKGQITVQDESSALVAQIAGIKPHHKVLDTCAAPGGKTTHMATYVDKASGGYVQAVDLHEHKIQLIEANAKRLHVLDNITARQGDARSLSTLFKGELFDVVFVDAPCSGLGLMRRKPDIKYTKTALEIESLISVQADILNEAAKMVKRGGTLIYSTCTTTTKENEEQVKTFLNTHADFSVVPITLDTSLENCLTKEGYVSILPHQFKTDGFFIAKLQKN